MFPGPTNGPGNTRTTPRLVTTPTAGTPSLENALLRTPRPADTTAKPGAPMTIISRRLPAAPETAAHLEYGILAKPTHDGDLPRPRLRHRPDASVLEARI